MKDAVRTKQTVPSIRARKRRGPAIVALTAYDHPTAAALDQAGVDVILVGDSVGMAVLGMDSTLPVTLDTMVHHTRAVCSARPSALVVADMPFLSYHVSIEETMRNAGRLVQEAGAESVKLEGGRSRVAAVRALTDAGIPVMGHIGLTPQAVHAMGGYRVQGKTPEAIQALVDDIHALEDAGVFAVVLEGLPVEVARLLTEAAAVPTIGIGAGPYCDGQILVVHDLLGWSATPAPKFVRRYADLRGACIDAARRFAADVRSGGFPALEECYVPKLHVAEPGEVGAGPSDAELPGSKSGEADRLH